MLTFEVIKSAFYFLAILSVLVIVHEWGHFIVAKLCGMHVEDFSLFFGKVVKRLGVRNGTVYNIRAIPLGGFVKIVGMEPEDISNGAPIFHRSDSGKLTIMRGLRDDSFDKVNMEKIGDRVRETAEKAVVNGELTPWGQDAVKDLLRGTSINDDEHRYLQAIWDAHTQAQHVDPNGYNQKPLWQRAAVIFAGPFMSIVFGYFLFCMMGVTTGFPDSLDSPTKVLVVKGSVADKAGVKDNDRIVSINGNPTPTWMKMQEQVRPHAGENLQIVVERVGQTLQLNATPSVGDDENGKPVGRLGVGMAEEKITWRRYSLIGSIGKGTEMLKNNILGILQLFKSKRIKENIGGPIAIASVVHHAGKEGAGGLVWTAAQISVSLGIFNLLPIPLLDGGHLLLLAIEFVRRRKLSMREMQTAQLIGISIIGVLFVLVMFNDISRLPFFRK